MGMLAEKAKALRAKSKILEGRNVISSDDVVKMFGKSGFTVIEIDCCNITDRKTGEPRHYYLMAIKEDETVAIGSGQVLTNILDNLVETCGSIEEMNAALQIEDFILIPEMKRSRNGNRYLDFEVK